jgi:hypothetical protein
LFRENDSSRLDLGSYGSENCKKLFGKIEGFFKVSRNEGKDGLSTVVPTGTVQTYFYRTMFYNIGFYGNTCPCSKTHTNPRNGGFRPDVCKT